MKTGIASSRPWHRELRRHDSTAGVDARAIVVAPERWLPG
jgi:hypothetical protein